MSLRRVETGPELAEVELLATNWSASPHQPALSEETRFQFRSGRGAAFVSEGSGGMAALTTTKRREIGMVEVAVPEKVSASDFWDQAEPYVLQAGSEAGHRALELLTWDPGLRGELADRGWQRVRAINRGTRTSGPAAAAGPGPGTPSVASGATSPNVLGEEMPTSFTGGKNDVDGLLHVNNLAFASHPEAGNWSRTGLEARFEEPWFDPAGLLLTRDGPVVTGFCWTKIHPDGVGEVYLLAVRPDHSGQGLGRALVGAGIEYLTVQRGCTQTIVYWDVSNKVASNLYQSIGFSVDQVAEVFRHRL